MPDKQMIGGAVSHDQVAATLIDQEDHHLTVEEHQALYDLFRNIGRAWGNVGEDSAEQSSSWHEFIVAKTEQPPSYAGEYANAVAVVQELVDMYGEHDAFDRLFFDNGIPDGPPTTRLAHAKRFVVDEFIRVQVVAGGFKGFSDPASLNYSGYLRGSRYSSRPLVRSYVPTAPPSQDGQS